MSVVISLVVGVPLGIASSIIAWWILAHMIRPRLSWWDPRFVPSIGSPPGTPFQLSIRLRNDSKRDAIDISIHAELRVSHPQTPDGVTRTLIRFPLNSDWMPRIQNEARIRVEQQKIPDWEWNRLRSRVGTDCTDLEHVLQKCEGSTIRFYALAHDQFSGARRIFVEEYEARQIQRGDAVSHELDN